MVKNIVIGSEKPKKQGRPKGSTVAAKIEKKSVSEVNNPAWSWFDGEDNEGDNIDLFVSGKKLVWKKIYQVYQTGIKKKFDVDKDLYFKDYVDPRFIVFNKKTKQEIFNVSGRWGAGFIELCNFMNSI